jgi:hypothetical protein
MSKDIITRPTTKVTLKRKVGYIDEEASVTRTKFAQMEITQENEQMEITQENENKSASGPSTPNKEPATS